MDYKTLYKELATILASLGCFICDEDSLGHCKLTEKYKAFVFIKSRMSYKNKFFVLAHEAGHLFQMKAGNLFCWCKKERSEKQANWYAIQILRLTKCDIGEYYKFYNETKNKKKRKSWHQI